MNKVRITVKQSLSFERIWNIRKEDGFWKVVSTIDIKRHGDLMGYVRYLQSIDCKFSADGILSAIRVS